MKRLGTLLGLILFMVTSPAFAVSWRVKVYNLESYETRTYTPPGNVEFKIPMRKKSKWSCVLKPAADSELLDSRTIECAVPEGYSFQVTCSLMKEDITKEREAHAFLSFTLKESEERDTEIGFYCDR